MVLNVYLNNVCMKIKVFEGIFAPDNLYRISNWRFKDKQSIIVNTEEINSNIIGHWILISRYYKNEKIILEIFDSLCTPMFLLHSKIKYFLISISSDEIIHSNKIIQHYNSKYCGLFCLCRILSINNNESLKDHLKMYSHNSILNNSICYKYIRETLNDHLLDL